MLVNACQDETSLVQSLRALGGGTDAHRRERVPHAGEETALLGQSAAVADHGEGVHLQAVVVVETQGLVLDHPLVQLEAGLLQTLFAAGMAAVQHGHVILLRHFVDGRKEAYKVLLRVDILLPVGGKQNVLSLFQSQAGVDIAGLDFLQVLVEHFGHGAACDIGALLGQTVLRQVAAGVLRVAQVHIGNNVHDAAVGLLRKALVLAAVAGFHVENWDVQPLGPDDAEAGVGVPQHQDGVGLQLRHQVVAFGDDVPHGLAQGVPHRVQVDVRVGQLQVMEEHTVEVIVVVLAGVGQEGIEMLPALGDDRGQADDLRPGAHDDEKFQFAVVLKRCFSHIKLFPFGSLLYGGVQRDNLSVYFIIYNAFCFLPAMSRIQTATNPITTGSESRKNRHMNQSHHHEYLHQTNLAFYLQATGKRLCIFE